MSQKNEEYKTEVDLNGRQRKRNDISEFSKHKKERKMRGPGFECDKVQVLSPKTGYIILFSDDHVADNARKNDFPGSYNSLS